jgi:hypothetical protein
MFAVELDVLQTEFLGVFQGLIEVEIAEAVALHADGEARIRAILGADAWVKNRGQGKTKQAGTNGVKKHRDSHGQFLLSTLNVSLAARAGTTKTPAAGRTVSRKNSAPPET